MREKYKRGGDYVIEYFVYMGHGNKKLRASGHIYCCRSSSVQHIFTTCESVEVLCSWKRIEI